MKLLPVQKFSDRQWEELYEGIVHPRTRTWMTPGEHMEDFHPVPFDVFKAGVVQVSDAGKLFICGVFLHDSDVTSGYAVAESLEDNAWEIGVALFSPETHRRGVGFRAHSQLVEFLFGPLGAEKVYAREVDPNSGVASMLLRMNYTREGDRLVLTPERWRAYKQNRRRRRRN